VLWIALRCDALLYLTKPNREIRASPDLTLLRYAPHDPTLPDREIRTTPDPAAPRPAAPDQTMKPEPCSTILNHAEPRNPCQTSPDLTGDGIAPPKRTLHRPAMKSVPNQTETNRTRHCFAEHSLESQTWFFSHYVPVFLTDTIQYTH